MKTLLGLFFVVVCLAYLVGGGYMGLELCRMVENSSITATQSAVMTLLVVASLFFTVVSYRASRFAFKGQLGRFWRLLNLGWLPV